MASNLSGKGKAQVPATQLCTYLDLVSSHFNDNAVNSVVVYTPPSWGGCVEKMVVAGEVINLTGSQEMIARAQQQLLALLLNVAAGYISLTEVVSTDGATVSQAITFCDNVIDDPLGDHERAKTICDLINNGKKVSAGLIPLDTQQIAYRLQQPGAPDEALLAPRAWPTPGVGAIHIQYGVPAGGQPVRLEIFSVAGQRVRTLVDANQPRGSYQLVWSGEDDQGRLLRAGIYLYRLRLGEQVIHQRMVLLR